VKTCQIERQRGVAANVERGSRRGRGGASLDAAGLRCRRGRGGRECGAWMRRGCDADVDGADASAGRGCGGAAMQTWTGRTRVRGRLLRGTRIQTRRGATRSVGRGCGCRSLSAAGCQRAAFSSKTAVWRSTRSGSIRSSPGGAASMSGIAATSSMNGSLRRCASNAASSVNHSYSHTMSSSSGSRAITKASVLGSSAIWSAYVCSASSKPVRPPRMRRETHKQPDPARQESARHRFSGAAIGRHDSIFPVLPRNRHPHPSPVPDSPPHSPTCPQHTPTPTPQPRPLNPDPSTPTPTPVPPTPRSAVDPPNAYFRGNIAVALAPRCSHGSRGTGLAAGRGACLGWG